MKVAAISDIGLKRNINQDAYFCDETHNMFIVADGMGGHKAGELASRLAVDEIKGYLLGEEGEDKTPTDTEIDVIDQVKKGIKLAVHTANRKIYALARENPEYHGMGTTVVICQLMNDKAVCAHVGDSRIYLLRNGSLMQITKDHSRVQELIDMEKLTEEEAEKYPMKNVITRALGGDAEVEVDITTLDIESSDVMLLCSDGLTSVVPLEEIQKIIMHHAGNPVIACKDLIRATHAKGAPDNTTIVLLQGVDFGKDKNLNMPASEELKNFQLYPENNAEKTEIKKSFWSALLHKLGIGD